MNRIARLKIALAQRLGIACEIELVRPKDAKGNIAHYYHFVADALVPIALLIQRFPELKCTLPMDRLGAFRGIAEELFQENLVDRAIWKIQVVGMNPKKVEVSAEQWQMAREWTFHRLGLSMAQDVSRKYILLIDRTDEGVDRGQARRSIRNMDELEVMLRSALADGIDLMRVDLARTPWQEQLTLFRDALLVVGQHGAGLVNMLWMQPEAPVVEMGNFRAHFVKMSAQMQRPHCCFDVMSDHTDVSLASLALFLRSQSELDGIFDGKVLDVMGQTQTPPPHRSIIIITGLPKTGTSLVASLLDGHPDLFVFPQELRFFHLKIHELPPREAHAALFANINIQALSKEIPSLSTGGTGLRDKPNLTPAEFESFSAAVLQGFLNSMTIRDRFEAIFDAWQKVVGGTEGKTWVIRAPQSARFAPHFNALFDGNVKWVLTNRKPSEHMASLRKYRSRRNSDFKLPIHQYIQMLARNESANTRISPGNSYRLQLESLQNPDEQFVTINELYQFLELPTPETMPAPTTLGAPWYGNMQSGPTSEISKPHKPERVRWNERIQLSILLRLHSK